MIGVVLPTLNSKVSSRVVTSIGRYLREQGYETLIKDSDTVWTWSLRIFRD